MKKPLHFHKYERRRWPSGKAYYKCMEVGCSHYLTILELAISRESLCWGPGCNRLVTITKEDVAKETWHPMCDSCKKERSERKEEMSRI